MYRLFALLIAIGFFVSGCAMYRDKKVEVYTFEQERVDQGSEGNKGYITGDVPAGFAGNRNTKRTLIGIDIEVPDFIPGGKDESTSGKVKRVRRAKAKKSQVIVEEKEDEWIK